VTYLKTRSKFIKETGIISAGIYCGLGTASFLNSCINLKYVQATVDNKKLKVSKAEFGQNTFVVVRYEGLPAPVYLNKLNESLYNALLMRCTHKQCEIKPTGNFLVCPCHGSEFSNTGKVLTSPAERDLISYLVTSDNQNIYIHLNKKQS